MAQHGQQTSPAGLRIGVSGFNMAYLAQLNGMSGMNPLGIDTICVRPHSAYGADTLLGADSASLGLALVLTSVYQWAAGRHC